MTTTSRFGRRPMAILLVLLLGMTWLPSRPAAAAADRLTNLAHLDFLLDEVRPTPTPAHSTYSPGPGGSGNDPSVLMPWTYADARPGGTFERIGGGRKDPTTGDYAQGAFNTDDIARAAVVYLRAWQQTGESSSRDKAYQLLRAVAFMQTTTGRNAGNFVLWMQPDGDLNPSGEPAELPDPSDSGPSYWLARGTWALGEGYAAFRRTDPAFARFLSQRMDLAVDALDRQVLSRYGRYRVADGRRVPAWLIVNGADATAEAVLGLSAYVAARRDDQSARAALSRLSEGVAAMGSSDRRSWPYGAIRPWAESGSIWHAWSSQMSAALARSSTTLRRPALLGPAVTEVNSLDPTLITSGGPDNGWSPTPVDRTQIAYGVDSRIQSLLAVADATGAAGPRDLAGLTASWYFGTNASGTPVYDRATGITFDGVAADGSVNANSGAESTIHGLLSMLALDAHPAVRALARSTTGVISRRGLSAVQGEDATRTTGKVATPDSAWSGEWQWGGGSYLRLTTGQRARLSLPSGQPVAWAEPVVEQRERGRAASLWWAQRDPLGHLVHRAGPQGITPVAGSLLPQRLRRAVPAGSTRLDVYAAGHVDLDAVLLRPLLERTVMRRGDGRVELAVSTATGRHTVALGVPGEQAIVTVYDRSGREVRQMTGRGPVPVEVPGQGYAVLRAG